MTHRHPIRWIGKRPSKNFAQIPNELCRDRLSTRARSVALYLWSQRDGWELAPTSIHHDLGMDYKTATKALQELSEHRWLAIRTTGTRSKEYYANPARRLTEAEHESLTRSGQVEVGESPKANGSLSLSTTPVNGSKSPTKNTSLLEDKNTNTASSLTDKTKIREMVDSIVPASLNRNHLTNVAVKAGVELHVTLSTIEAAIQRWMDETDGTRPGSLYSLIADEMENDLPTVVERCIETLDVTPLARFGFHYEAPEPPVGASVDDVRALNATTKAAWLRNVQTSYAGSR